MNEDDDECVDSASDETAVVGVILLLKIISFYRLIFYFTIFVRQVMFLPVLILCQKSHLTVIVIIT